MAAKSVALWVRRAFGEDRADIDAKRRRADDQHHQNGADDGEAAALIGAKPANKRLDYPHRQKPPNGITADRVIIEGGFTTLGNV